MRIAVLSLVLAGLWLAAGPANAQAVDAHLSAAAVPLYPGRPADTRAGKLIYRGGLVLASENPGFGGWSGLIVSEDGTHMLAMSDAAHWLTARLAYDARGDLIGATKGRIAPMLNRAGRPMSKHEGDAEGLTAAVDGVPDGVVYASFEGNDRVWRYDLSHGIGHVLPQPVPMGAWIKRQKPNEGLEAITVMAPGTLLALSESMKDAHGDITGALEIVGKGGKTVTTKMLGIVPHPPFHITSVARDGHGGVYLLERRFSLTGGLGMEIRHIDAAEIHPGARIKGQVLTNLSLQNAGIDNMEGLSVRHTADGRTLLYVISDDNYMRLVQRTLLFQFEVPKGALQ